MRVGAYEAKARLSDLLRRVAGGERITITRHGQPVAVLVPPPGAASMPVREAIARIRALRRGRRLDGLSLKEAVAEGRR